MQRLFLFFVLCFQSINSYSTTLTTITIDGTEDFEADEEVGSNALSTWYMTWDATTLYVGVNQGAVGSGCAKKWVWFYFDTDPQTMPLSGNGSSSAVGYGTDNSNIFDYSLPFNADFHLRWKADGSYTNMLDYNNGSNSWTDDNTGNNNFSINKAKSGTYIEFSIPLASLGNPSAIHMTALMFDESGSGGSGYAFASLPSSNIDGSEGGIMINNFYGEHIMAGVDPFSSENALAVELASLVAKRNIDNTIGVFWTTATEINNDYFNIQKSNNDNVWENIGRVEGKGNSYEIVNYEFIDERPFGGMNYYRLQQIDYDGYFEYSKVVSVDFNQAGKFSVFPNPVSKELTIEFEKELKAELTIHIYSMEGRLLKTYQMKPFQRQMQLDIEELNKGVYFLKLKSEKGVVLEIQKFFKT